MEIVKLLLDRGALVEARNITPGFTSLMFASENGHIEVVKLLLNHGAQVEAESGDKSLTSLMLARNKGQSEVEKLLLDHGAVEKEFKLMFFDSSGFCF